MLEILEGLVWADQLTILLFLGLILYIVLGNIQKDATKEMYFMAGKNLTWPIIGCAVFATNLSTEHFIGMVGASFKKGFVMACYEWLGIMMIIGVAVFILPRYLRAGINTLPEYLEYRYSPAVRLVVSSGMFLAYVFLTISGMLYANVLAVDTMFGLNSPLVYWVLALLSGIFAILGGLRTIVKLHVVFTVVMLCGGVVIAILALQKVGGVAVFASHASAKLHTLLPSTDPDLPWHSIILGGFWFGAIFYFGFNQYILQKLFTTRSLSVAQKGFLFAASLKVLVPFIIVLPGVLVASFYTSSIIEADASYPVLALKVLPDGFKGFFYCMMISAIFGSFISILNSVATVFSYDIYKRFVKPDATDAKLISVGRWTIALVLIVACIWAPNIHYFGGVFVYIKKYFGLIYPSVIVLFLFGWMSKRVGPNIALTCVLLNPPLFVLYSWLIPTHVYLTIIAYVTITLAVFVMVGSLAKPYMGRIYIPNKENVQFERNLGIFVWAIFLFSTSLALLVIFI